jgi:uncharacterized protein
LFPAFPVIDGRLWFRMGKARIIHIKVKPNARISLLEERDGGWQARLKAPPMDGRANAELVALVADHFGCSKAAVTIKSGGARRLKLVRIAE